MAEVAASSSAETAGSLLETPWTWWYEKRTQTHPPADNITTWEDNLIRVGSFETLEMFHAYYTHLVRPSQMPKQSTYYIFRNELKPCWENYPDGAHWMIVIKKLPDRSRLDRLWEQLIFACIGEEFEDPYVVGAVVSIRVKEDVFSLWVSDKAAKFRVGERLKKILHMGMNCCMEWKTHRASIRDESGKVGAQVYMIPEEATAATSTQKTKDATPKKNKPKSEKAKEKNQAAAETIAAAPTEDAAPAAALVEASS